MPTRRDDDRAWLEKEAVRFPSGWEAGMIEDFGMEGALDLLALQEGRVAEVDLRHRPFVGNGPLKRVVRDTQNAVNALSRGAYQLWWEAAEKRRATQ